MGTELESKETQEMKTQEQSHQEEQQTDDFADQMSQMADMMSAFEPEKTEETSEEKEEQKETQEEQQEEEQTEEKVELTPQEKEIAELKAQVAALTEKLSNPEKAPEKKEEQQTEEGYFKERLEEVQKDLVSEYVSDDEYEVVFEKREKLNEVLKRVQSDTLQGVFRSIPKIIASIIPQQVMLYSKTAEFYKENPDLLEHRTKVGELIDKVSAENPGWDLNKVLEHVGGKYGDENDVGALRKTLGLKKKAEKKAEQSNIRRPSFAKPSHMKQPGKEVKLTGINKEIADMMDATT